MNSVWLLLLGCVGLVTAGDNYVFNQGGCGKDCACTQGCCNGDPEPFILPTTTSNFIEGVLGLTTGDDYTTTPFPIGSTSAQDSLANMTIGDKCDTSEDVFMMYNIQFTVKVEVERCEFFHSELCAQNVNSGAAQANNGVYWAAYDAGNFQNECTQATAVSQVAGTLQSMTAADISAAGNPVIKAFTPPLVLEPGQSLGFGHDGSGSIMYRHPTDNLVEHRFCLAAGSPFGAGAVASTTFDLSVCNKARKWGRRYYQNCFFRQVV